MIVSKFRTSWFMNFNLLHYVYSDTMDLWPPIGIHWLWSWFAIWHLANELQSHVLDALVSRKMYLVLVWACFKTRWSSLNRAVIKYEFLILLLRAKKIYCYHSGTVIGRSGLDLWHGCYRTGHGQATFREYLDRTCLVWYLQIHVHGRAWTR